MLGWRGMTTPLRLHVRVDFNPRDTNHDGRPYRLWIVNRPAGWCGPFNSRPPHAQAIGLVMDGTCPLPLALAMLQAFNTEPERSLDGLWMIAQPVRVVYAGDCLAGEFID